MRLTVWTILSSLGCLLLATATMPQLVVAADKDDWAYWRGPQMNGHSTIKGLPDSWDPAGGEGSNLVWKRDDLGTISTPVAMNGKLYLLCRHKPGTDEQQEKVVCVDAATGDTVWENIFNVYLSDVPDTRVAWSNVVADPTDGHVYALGVCGLFQKINAETGETVASHSMHEEYGLLSTYGGRTNFPIIHENNVIISAVVIGWGEMAKPAHRFIAFDKRTFQPVWFESTRLFPDDTTYSGTVLTKFNGQAALVFGSGDGAIYAFQPRTGKEIWKYDVSSRGINATPLVVGNAVYGGHSEENLDSTKMGAFFRLDGTSEGEIAINDATWRQTELYAGRSTPLMIDDRLYVIDDRAKMHIVDPKTGEEIAEQRMGTMMRSSPLYADGKIYTCTFNGRWYTMKPTKEGVEVLHKMRLDGESQGSPIAASGRLYVPTTEALYCIGSKSGSPMGELPKMAGEASPEADQQVAQLQVVPVESMLLPGQGQDFDVRGYNAQGQWVRNLDRSEVQFEVDGPGQTDGKGSYKVPVDLTEPAAVTITAKMGDVKGTARVRAIPPLDWKVDFDNGQIPVTWVGSRYRNIVLDYDLLTKLQKKDEVAAQLYIYLMSSFTNSGRDSLTYDDSTPAMGYSELIRFLGWDTGDKRPTDAQDALAKFEPHLEVLKGEKVLGDFGWSTWKRSDGAGGEVDAPQLLLDRGEREIDGNGVMCKITTIPKGARSQSWMGYPDLHDYTIQADVLGAERNGNLPDIGLIAQRYTFDMMGANQELQIRTWTPQLQMAETVPFEWKPETWYTIKFEASNADGKAILRGKVWEKAKTEPKEWLITAEDPIPNTQGSPGMFGNAKTSEIYYDNVTVTQNAQSKKAKSKKEDKEVTSR